MHWSILEPTQQYDLLTNLFVHFQIFKIGFPTRDRHKQQKEKN
jgi:hypothetical protein